MASTRYGKVSDDLELSTRSRNPQARDVQWFPPDEDRRGPEDLKAKVLFYVRRLTLCQKVGIGCVIFLSIVYMLLPSTEYEIRPLLPNFQSSGTIMEVIRNSPVFDLDDNGQPIKLMIGEVFAGHLVDAGPTVQNAQGHKFILLDRGGAVPMINLKLADPQDAARFRAETLGQQEDDLASDYNAVAIQPGTPLQVVRAGPVYNTDQHGVVWGQEVSEVRPGQVVHAAGTPVTEDGHTTVALESGGAIDVSLVQVLEHPQEADGEQLENGEFVPPGQHFRPHDDPAGEPGGEQGGEPGQEPGVGEPEGPEGDGLEGDPGAAGAHGLADGAKFPEPGEGEPGEPGEPGEGEPGLENAENPGEHGEPENPVPVGHPGVYEGEHPEGAEDGEHPGGPEGDAEGLPGDSEHLGHPDEGQPADGDGDGEPGREGGDGQEFQDFQEVSEGGVG